MSLCRSVFNDLNDLALAFFSVVHIYIITRSFKAIVLQKNSWFSNIFSLGVNFVQNKNGYISYIYDDMTSKIKRGFC